MSRKTTALLMALCVAVLLLPHSAFAGIVPLKEAQLLSLTHNAPVTGIMMPAAFNPLRDNYLLTVASWVSRITITPVAASPYAQIHVQGQLVESGSPSPIIRLNDEPTLVTIAVTAYDEGGTLLGSSEYTVYIQRRPSDRRTRVSAGYIAEISLQDGVAAIAADLVTLRYEDNSNVSSFVNDTVYLYRYNAAPNCLYFYGDPDQPTRARNAQVFIDNYLLRGSNLYYFVYIEDKVVAVFPYAPD